MTTITILNTKIDATLARLHNGAYADHRVWKRLLRHCAESVRTLVPGKRSDPCMTTAVDKAARQAVRRYTKRSIA